VTEPPSKDSAHDHFHRDARGHRRTRRDVTHAEYLKLDPDTQLRCSGHGPSQAASHHAPACDFALNSAAPGRGFRQTRCRRCACIAASTNGRRRTRQLAKLTDEQIRETKTTKRCSKCDIVKPSVDFIIHRNNADGLRSDCTVCHRTAVINTTTPRNQVQVPSKTPRGKAGPSNVSVSGRRHIRAREWCLPPLRRDLPPKSRI
jgi:hypothetical protein